MPRWGSVGERLGRPWRAGGRLLARTPLRLKLTAAVLLLVTVTLAIISVASVTVLRGYLVGRLDDQLEAVARRFDRPPPDQGRGGHPPGDVHYTNLKTATASKLPSSGPRTGTVYRASQ